MNESFNDPALAILAVVAGPFLVRASIAWYVQLRIWGFFSGVRGGSFLRRSDFPSPNEPLRETVLALGAFVVGGWLGNFADRSGIGPSSVWLAVNLAVAAICVVWWFRRLRADDRRALAVRQRRQAEGEMERFDAAAKGGELW